MVASAVKTFIKASLPALPRWRRQWRSRRERVGRLLYYVSDLKVAWRHMHWAVSGRTYWQLSSELLFQYHKLEKGLCMPGTPRFFGEAPVLETMRLLHLWPTTAEAQQDPVYLGAMGTLLSYRRRIQRYVDADPRAAQTAQSLDVFLNRAPASAALFDTPLPQVATAVDAAAVFDNLTQARRSVRHFRPEPVAPELLQRAIAVAQRSPSACNRQPWHVHVFTDRAQMDALFALQNGNRGFGHTVPMLLLLTVDASGFFDASERNQPYIDGGLFSMSLVLALQSLGLSSCCLNWCVSPATDASAHQLARVPGSERILMYLAVGYAAESSPVPRSPRRSLSSFVHFH